MKIKVRVQLFIENPSQGYGALPAIRNLTVLPSCHQTQVNAP